MLIASLVGAIAYRRNNTKQLRDIQDKVIETYKTQNELQEKQIKLLEKKITHLENVLNTLGQTLKHRRGLLIEIHDEVITLIDQRTGTEHTVQVRTTGQPEKEPDEKAP